MKPYIGHHTCSQRGGRYHVTQEAPFLAEYFDARGTGDRDEFQHPFLGSGYYFWEFDIEQAKYWGRTHVGRLFFVLQANINTTNENFLDLVGDLQIMGWVLNRANQLVDEGLIDPDWCLSELIEYLKGIEQLEPGNFEYQIIRARDFVSQKNDYKVYFNERNNYTYLTGRHIFCLTEKNDVILSDKKIVFTS